MAKKWTSCISCDFQNDCEICHLRLDNFDKTSAASEDVGCFNFEMIKKQKRLELEKNQLKLFKL